MRNGVIIVIVTVIFIVIIATTLILMSTWKQADNNVYDIFGEMLTIKEIKQPDRIPFPTYRAYNPCIFNLHDEDNYWTALRMCNFIQCSDRKNNWDKNNRHLTNSHTILLSPSGDRYLISHPDVSGKTINGKGCERGCEDSRIVATKNEIFIICNSTSGFDCTRQMRLMRVYLNQIYEKNDGTSTLHDIKVDNVETLNINWDRPKSNEKNWMPWIYQEELHFVYSVNPHIILKYTAGGKNNVDVVSVNKYIDNPLVPGELRGGSQILRATKWHKKTLGDGYVAEDLYIAVLHVRNSNSAYTTYIYGFEPKHPFSIKYITRGFVFGNKASHTQGIQFASGLARVYVKNVPFLNISYGEDDCNAKLCTVKEEDVMKAFIAVS